MTGNRYTGRIVRDDGQFVGVRGGRNVRCELQVNQTLLRTDFDAGLPAGWSVTGLWTVTDSCAQEPACEGGNWAYFGLPAGGNACTFNTGAAESGVLTAATIALPATANRITLSYCSVYDGQAGNAPDGDDAAWVTVNGELIDDVSGTVITGGWETRWPIFSFGWARIVSASSAQIQA